MAHSTPINEDEHFEERQKKIYAACSYLFQLGFDKKLFTIKNIYKHGYTDDEFIELIKPLTSINDMDDYDLTHLSEQASRCFATLPPFKFRNFLNFSKWMYEAEGKRTLAFLSNKNKNIVRKDFTEAEVSLARMFIDYGDSLKLKRDRIGREIVKLSIQQRQLEMEHESIEEELKRKLGPLYEYKEPEITDLRIEAYKLYEENCKAKGITPLPKYHNNGFKKAMEEFGDIAKERLQLVNYLNDPVRQKKVRNFFKGKIYRMERVTDGGETSIVYKFATDVCEEISSDNIVYKHESEAREKNCDDRKATTIIYEFGSDNVPPLPDSKKAKLQEQEQEPAAKKMKSVTLG